MGSEHLLVHHASAAVVGKGLRHDSGVAGLGDGRHAGGEAGLEPLAGREQILVARPGLLETSDPTNPHGELVVINQASESGQVKMRVGVHQSRHQSSVRIVFSRNTGRCRDVVVGTDGLEAAVRTNQDRAGRDRWMGNRVDPFGT